MIQKVRNEATKMVMEEKGHEEPKPIRGSVELDCLLNLLASGLLDSALHIP